MDRTIQLGTVSVAAEPVDSHRPPCYAKKYMANVPNSLVAGLGGAIDSQTGPSYCSSSQTAALLGVSRVSVWRWIRDGRLPSDQAPGPAGQGR
jgi:hypothetical protein